MSRDRRAFITGLAALAGAAGLPSIAVSHMPGGDAAAERFRLFKDYCEGLNGAQLEILRDLLARLVALPEGASAGVITAEAIGKISAHRG